MRGVEQGRGPEYRRVRPAHARWRKLEFVREIAARKRPARSSMEAAEELRELERPRERIRDEDELSYHVTRLAMLVTRAESAMLHLRHRFERSFHTRAVL